MQKTFIVILVIILAVVFFALDNSTTVNIKFWLWSTESNLSLVLILSVIIGAIISSLLSLPYRNKMIRELRTKEKKIKSQEEEIRQLKSVKTDSFDMKL